MAPRHILFDLDGTLLDTLADITAATNAGLAAIDRPPLASEAVNAMVGRGLDVLLLLAVGGAPTEEEKRCAREAFDLHYAKHCLDATRPFPAVPRILAELEARGVEMGVLSNKPVDYTEKILAGLGLRRRFGPVLGPPIVAAKPDPAGIISAALFWSVPEREILFVGDSDVDRATAAAAGCAFFAAPRGLCEIPFPI